MKLMCLYGVSWESDLNVFIGSVTKSLLIKILLGGKSEKEKALVSIILIIQ